jgi:hypothetical protein
MDKRLRLLLIALCGVAMQSPAQVQITVNAKGPRLNRILRADAKWTEESKKQEEWPGSATVKLNPANPELTLRLWEIGNQYYLEFLVDTRQSNSEILDPVKNAAGDDPTGDPGFFHAQLEGANRVTIDLKCEPRMKLCTGKWESFPFLPGSKQKLSVISSMAGFKRNWKIDLEVALPEKIAAGAMPQALTLKDAHGEPGGEVVQTLLYNKDVYKNPFSDLQYAPIRIDVWQIKKLKDESGVGFHKQPRSVLFEVTEGVAKIDLLAGTQYSTFEVRTGERLWTPSGAAISVHARGGKGENSAVLRRVEFP